MQEFKVCETCCLHLAETSIDVEVCPRCGQAEFEHGVHQDGELKLDCISFCGDANSSGRPEYFMGVMIKWEDDDDEDYDDNCPICQWEKKNEDHDVEFDNFILKMDPADMLVLISNCVRALAVNEKIDRKSAVDFLTPSLNMLCERAKFDSTRQTEAN